MMHPSDCESPTDFTWDTWDTGGHALHATHTSDRLTAIAGGFPPYVRLSYITSGHRH